MASDIKIKITGDDADVKKVVKSSSKLVKRFEKVNKRSTARRVKDQEGASRQIQQSEKNKNIRLEAMDRRLSKKRARIRLKRMKENIRLARKEARAIEKIRKGSFKRGFGRLGKFGKYGLAGLGIGGVAGIFVAGREIINFDLLLTRIAVQAKITTKEQEKLRDSVTDASVAYGLSRNEILEGISAIVDKSGDLGLATFLMEKMSKASVSLGADMYNLGLFATSLKSGLGATNEETAEFLEILSAQADIGSVVIKDFAALGPKLFGAAAAAGVRGAKALTEFGALVQIAGLAGSSEEAITAMTNLMAELAKKRKKILKLTDFDIKDVETGGLKNIAEAVKAIIRLTGGKQQALFDLGFGLRAIKPMQLLAAEFRRTGGNFETLDDLVSVVIEGMDKKFDRVSQTSAIKLAKMKALLVKLSDIVLTKTLDNMIDSLSEFLSKKENIDDFTESAVKLGKALVIVADAIITLAKWSGKLDPRPGWKKLEYKKGIEEEFLSLPEMGLAKKLWLTKFGTFERKEQEVLGQRKIDNYLYVNNNITMDRATGEIVTKSIDIREQKNYDTGKTFVQTTENIRLKNRAF